MLGFPREAVRGHDWEVWAVESRGLAVNSGVCYVQLGDLGLVLQSRLQVLHL